MKRSSARRARRWILRELTRLLDQHKPKENFGAAAYGIKLKAVASQGLLRWTTLIARPRRRRNRMKPP